MKTVVAYRGPAFTIEWYYDSEYKSSVLTYFLKLNPERQDQVFKLFRLLGDRGKINNITKFRNEGDSIYAFKPKPDRFLCFFYKGKKIIVTNAFEKKQDKLPVTEKQKALLIKENYERRVEEGVYYGK